MEIIFKYFWIVFIVVTIVNALIVKFQSQKHMAKNQELKEGYDKAVTCLILYGNIPWVIMGVGNLSGMTNNIFDYFDPRGMNPIVLIFHLSIIVLWILMVKWIYFNNGAEFIEAHPGLVRKSNLSGNSNVTAKEVKFFFPLMLFGGVVAMIMMWVVDISIPKF